MNMAKKKTTRTKTDPNKKLGTIRHDQLVGQVEARDLPLRLNSRVTMLPISCCECVPALT